MRSRSIPFIFFEKSQSSQIEEQSVSVTCMHSYLKCQENIFPVAFFFFGISVMLIV